MASTKVLITETIESLNEGVSGTASLMLELQPTRLMTGASWHYAISLPQPVAKGLRIQTPMYRITQKIFSDTETDKASKLRSAVQFLKTVRHEKANRPMQVRERALKLVRVIEEQYELESQPLPETYDSEIDRDIY